MVTTDFTPLRLLNQSPGLMLINLDGLRRVLGNVPDSCLVELATEIALQNWRAGQDMAFCRDCNDPRQARAVGNG